MKKSLFIFLILSSVLAQSQIITTIAGNGVAGYSGDGGQATDAEIWGPSAVYVDKFGNTYITDALNNRIRMINIGGIITTIAGNGYNPGGLGGYSGDGGAATNAELYNPQSICIDTLGNIYIADYGNNRIRKVDTGGIISTITGNGIFGYSGDGGLATSSELRYPANVCFDTLGNLYIADALNYRIRKINTSGIITTVVGGGSNQVTDGVPATSVELGETYFLAINDSGNMYVSCTSCARVYKVDTTGNIYIVAGNRTIGYSGDGGPATAAEMYQGGICLDASSNLFIGDGANRRVREVSRSIGIITTVAGNGIAGYSGDGGPATDAELGGPDDIFMDAFNNLYIADYTDNRIRKVTNITGISFINNNIGFSIFPNPTTKTLNLNFNGLQQGLATLKIMDLTGRVIMSFSESVNNTLIQIDISSFTPGMYLITVKAKDSFITQKFIKQ